jgi:hypothetical protein
MTKEIFIAAHEKFKPNWFLRTAYKLVKYDSPNTLVLALFAVPFFGGFAALKTKLNKVWIAIAFLPFCLILLWRWIANPLNDIRLNKICKELNIDVNSYNKYLMEYGYNS